MLKKALVLGGGGFIGSHLVKKLKEEGFWVRAVDLKYPLFSQTLADDFVIGDLTSESVISEIMAVDNHYFDEIYQLAADMGGAGYIFTGNNDANVMTNSALINLLVCKYAHKYGVGSIFYSSSACAYPEYNQLDPNNPKCTEESAYPAAPDSEYGWEKLFSERLYLAYKRNFGLNCHIARYHNVYGPEGTYKNGKEKAPAALCRKVIEAEDGGEIEIWGDGKQTRSFLYIDACVEGTIRLTRSNFEGPVNIGSEEMISINDFAKMIIDISGKNIAIKNIQGPLGVRGRNSDNTLIREKLRWEPKYALKNGITQTYQWIESVYKI
jgi:GDP-D-mannose 3', 5'-epimerase